MMKAVVFVLRGCPAGWLGTYGNEWVATPNLDRVAAQGVVFDRHVSDRPDPDAWSAAVLGRALPSGSRLTDSLRAANVRTVLVRANHPETDGPDWFYAGWDEVFDARPREDDESPLHVLVREFPALLDRLAAVPDLLLWIEIDRFLPPWAVKQDVFEAYIHDEGEPSDLEEPEDDEGEDEAEDGGEEDEGEEDEETDERVSESGEEIDDATEPAAEPEAGIKDSEADEEPVTPWADPPTGPFDATDPDAWDWLHNSFATVVTTLDAELGWLFDELRLHGLDRSAAWVVTSDLGYPLGEHGQIGLHRPWLHQELVHLPLVVRLPGGEQAGRRVPGFTQPPDLNPTILALFGLTAPPGSLLPAARGAEATRPNAVTALEVNGASELAIRTPEWAFLMPVNVPEGEAREPRLYSKPDDRWEANDLYPRNVERGDELAAELRKAVGPDAAPSSGGTRPVDPSMGGG